MATHKSAEKRARQSIKRNARNTQTIGMVRSFEKKIRAALASGDTKTAKTLLSGLTSSAAKAASKGALHAKTAARKVSRISARVDQMASK